MHYETNSLRLVYQFFFNFGIGTKPMVATPTRLDKVWDDRNIFICSLRRRTATDRKLKSYWKFNCIDDISGQTIRSRLKENNHHGPVLAPGINCLSCVLLVNMSSANCATCNPCFSLAMFPYSLWWLYECIEISVSISLLTTFYTENCQIIRRLAWFGLA